MHLPVLLQEVIEGLDPKPGQSYIDGTAGAGGHTKAIWEKVQPEGRVLAIEWDKETCEALHKTLDSAITVAHGSYADVRTIAHEAGFNDIDGMLLDLGLSSMELEKSGRGFTFLGNEPLDMRFNVDQDLTAAEVVNTYDKHSIAQILRDFGEEAYANQIADSIVKSRKAKRIITTQQLVECIMSGIPNSYASQRINPATKTFQALRIAVNDELINVQKGLESGTDLLKSGGRFAVISFHSLEDRIVKNFFRDKNREGVLSIVTKKPVISGPTERRSNPRSRSAKLRIAQKR